MWSVNINSFHCWHTYRQHKKSNLVVISQSHTSVGNLEGRNPYMPLVQSNSCLATPIFLLCILRNIATFKMHATQSSHHFDKKKSIEKVFIIFQLAIVCRRCWFIRMFIIKIDSDSFLFVLMRVEWKYI